MDEILAKQLMNAVAKEWLNARIPKENRDAESAQETGNDYGAMLYARLARALVDGFSYGL